MAHILLHHTQTVRDHVLVSTLNHEFEIQRSRGTVLRSMGGLMSIPYKGCIGGRLFKFQLPHITDVLTYMHDVVNVRPNGATFDRLQPTRKMFCIATVHDP